jgi:hypothetical protein
MGLCVTTWPCAIKGPGRHQKQQVHRQGQTCLHYLMSNATTVDIGCYALAA